MKTILELALAYAKKGWHVFPIRPGSKEPYKDYSWDELASKDDQIIKTMWDEYPDSNVGIVCGEKSNLIVLDIDPRNGGNESFLNMVADNGHLPVTPESLTGGGGSHYLFQHPGKKIGGKKDIFGPGIDIKGDGGYIVAPPSKHPDGGLYEWEPSSLPSRIRVAQMPIWMVKELTSDNGHPLAEPVETTIQQGGRNLTLTSLAGTMRRRGMSPESIYLAIQEENETKCQPPLDDREVKRIAQSVGRYLPKAPVISKNGKKQEVQANKAMNAYEGIAAFLDILDNLEGRSIKTFIPKIDYSLGGLERQTLTVLAARPSMGKSTLAWQIARNIAANQMVSLFFSLEMATYSLWAKAACGACGVRWRDVRAQEVSQEQYQLVVDTATQLAERYGRYILVDETPNTTETIRLSIEKNKPDLVVVDHLRLVADTNESEVRRLGFITQQFKEMAKEYNLAFLCLAQLNRGVESRDNKRPTLADLRDSGQIEENADIVLTMYRPDYYDEQGKSGTDTELLVRKFRDDIRNQRIFLKFDAAAQWFGVEQT